MRSKIWSASLLRLASRALWGHEAGMKRRIRVSWVSYSATMKTNMPKRKPQARKRIGLRIRSWLSHHPVLYALVGGTGVILFWRGVWLTMDFLMYMVRIAVVDAHGDLIVAHWPWWDGPLSIVLGSLILLVVSAFVSSLIGNEIIISGLHAEKHVSEKEGRAIRAEALEIQAIQRTLIEVTKKLDQLEHDLGKDTIEHR